MVIGQYTPHSGLGNKLTQFASLYSLARDAGMPLSIPDIPGLPSIRDAISSCAPNIIAGSEPSCAIPGRHYINRNWIKELHKQTVMTGRYSYLENTYNFHHHKSVLASIVRPPSFPITDHRFYQGPLDRLKPIWVNRVGASDIVISLRLGDFVKKDGADDMWEKCVYTRFLGFSYFKLILNQILFDRLFITSDEPFHPLTKDFDIFSPIRVQNDDPLKTMGLVSQFRRIAISESTFSWWASYLSEADEIYFPISETGIWGVNEVWDKAYASWRPLNPYNVRDSDLYLRVDEDRYKYVHQASGIIYRYRDAPGKRSLSDFEAIPLEQQSALSSSPTEQADRTSR